jgi:acetyl-CoA carboxylase biotin carboxyl carrier protein
MAPEAETAESPLKALLEFAKSVDLEEVVWEKAGRRVAFKRAAAPAEAEAPAPEPSSPAAEAPPKTHIVHSPMVGTFWRSPGKDRPPLVMDGDEVKAGQRVAVVEAMKIPKDVVCDASGRIVRTFVENGKPVEYGQKLFEIEPAEAR